MMSNSENHKDKKSIEYRESVEDIAYETINVNSDHLVTSPSFPEIAFTSEKKDECIKVKPCGDKNEGLWALWANKGTLRIWSTPDTGGDCRTGISKLFITHDGKVGIGEPNPSAKLHVAGGATISGDLTMFAPKAEVKPSIKFRDTMDKEKWHIAQGLIDNISGLSFGEAGADHERLFLKEGGNIGIGTTSPEAKLHVAGDLKVTGKATISDLLTADKGLSISDRTKAGCCPPITEFSLYPGAM